MRRRIERLPGPAGGPIALMHQACFPEDPWDVGAIVQVMGIPGFFGHVEWREETPVGFALALNLGREAEILSLGVLREHRRAGVGTTLLDAVCSEARERGIRSVVLEVAVNNVAARALYAAMDVDEQIPAEHFEAVAKVIGFVMTNKQNRKRAWAD